VLSSSQRLLALAVALALTGCPAVDDAPAVYEPPGDGVAKGCRDLVEFTEPMVNGIGLSSHIPTGTSETDEARRAYEIERWAEMGVHLVRRDLHWTAIEPEKGVFDWTLPDRVLEATDAVGGETLGLLVYGNPWATADSDDSMTPPDDPADFANYAAAVAEQYQGRIRRYEVWNEENAGIRFWKPEEDPVAYAELLVEAADRIHEVDPTAQVSLGGLFHPELAFYTPGPEFLEAVFDAQPDLAQHIDAVAFHPYRYPFTEPEEQDTQESMFDAICGMYSLMDDHGGGDLELWITELGWHTAADALFAGVDEEEQAAYLVRSAVIALSQGIPVYNWYTFRDGGDDSEDQEDMFGLHGHDADPLDDEPAPPKLAADAYTVMSTQLGSHDTIEDLSVWLGLDAETFAYRLTGGSGEVVVLWSTSEAVEVLIPGDGEAGLVGMLGVSDTIQADGGAFSITAGPLPDYLLIP